MRTATNRRYSLSIAGELLDPEELNEIGAYNPRGLKAEAAKVAAHAALALDEEVLLVKHLAAGDREEGSYSPWSVRASRAIGRRAL